MRAYGPSCNVQAIIGLATRAAQEPTAISQALQPKDGGVAPRLTIMHFNVNLTDAGSGFEAQYHLRQQ